MKRNVIFQGDALAGLKTLPDGCVDMCMTSPPYWALRDYGVEGQLGLEPTFEEYIKKLCDIFDQVNRVLKPQGTCWVNLGDCYGGHFGEPNGPKLPKSGNNGYAMAARVKERLPAKCLVQIPARFSIEMGKRGWILRNELIWHKGNCIPSSAKDRFTVEFEKLFFFTKSKRYHFKTQSEPAVTGNPAGRNARCVWKINPSQFGEAHYATYPEALCEIPIDAGCPPEGVVLDPFFGAGTTGLVALKQAKDFVGIELNPEYVKMAVQRLDPFMPVILSD
jgi:site-specific DNA-methyltransferase (cytosine-N4-specific)